SATTSASARWRRSCSTSPSPASMPAPGPLTAWQTAATSAAGCSGTSARRSDRPPTLSSARGVMPSDPEKPTRLLLPTVIGHRGAARYAPENTLAGLRKAAELATSWVEFDVMLTADGTAVLHHD